MKCILLRAMVLLGTSFIYMYGNAATGSSRDSLPRATLRFDEAQTEEVADNPAVAPGDSLADSRAFAYKLNHRRVSAAVAYDTVTLWNVRKVRVKERRMRLSDTTDRESVRLLKFLIERKRKKGARPHLLGNVAGYGWSAFSQYDPETRQWRQPPKHIAAYTLLSECDSVSKANGGAPLEQVPEELWHELSPDAIYLLDGVRVPGAVFQFIDGVILRTLEIHTDSATMARYGVDRSVVVGDIYPDRRPLVIFNGASSTIESWLKVCRSGAFSLTADVPMRYFYMLPVEAVQLYGEPGKYGAVCIELAE